MGEQIPDERAHVQARPRKAESISAGCAGRIGRVGMVRRCLKGISRIEAQRLPLFRAQAIRAAIFFGE
jgi:hypothetical protein